MTPLDDEELRTMLEARAERVTVDPAAVIADGRRRANTSATAISAHRIVPSFLGIAAVVATLAMIVTLAMPTSVRPTGSATVSEAATPLNAPSAIPSAIEGAVTADQLDRLLRERDMVGRIVLLDGELVPAPNACTASPWCGRMIVGLTTPHSVLPSDALAAAYLVSPSQTKDLYALRVERTSGAGLVGLSVLGRVKTGGVTVPWLVETLAAGWPASTRPPSPRQAPPVEDLVEVTGWIVRTPVHPCPSTPGVPCAGFEDYLTADRYQPVQLDGSTLGPPAASSLFLQPGAYDAWAPDPSRLTLGVEPRQVTLLLRHRAPCRDDPGVRFGACLAPPHDIWEVVARLEPEP